MNHLFPLITTKSLFLCLFLILSGWIQQLTQIGEVQANNLQQAINWLNLSLNFLDEKLILAEVEMQKNNDFLPKLYYPAVSIIKSIYEHIKLYD